MIINEPVLILVSCEISKKHETTDDTNFVPDVIFFTFPCFPEKIPKVSALRDRNKNIGFNFSGKTSNFICTLSSY